MPAMIRPTRLEVNDRFPMLGFTIRTHGEPRRAEVAVATDPALLAPEGKARRSAGNFYSSRAGGPLAAPRGEAVYVLPPEILARFVGSEKLYFGLATAPATGPGAFEVEVLPTTDSPYVSLRALTGRSLRRVRVIPGRARGPGEGLLDWAGDTAQPGQRPAERASSQPANTNPPPAAHYDDGFGPMPAPAPTAPAPDKASASAPSTSAATPSPATSTPPPAAAKSMAWNGTRSPASAMSNDVTIGSVRNPVTAPPVTRLSGVARVAADAALMVLTGPLAPMIAALRLAATASAAAGTPVSIGLGPSVGAGLGAGGTLGAGIIFGPDNSLGVYGSAQFDVGFVLSVNASVQITVIRGAIDAFGGWSNSATISGGEGIVAGASALFDTQANFQGVSAQVGVGAGFSPVDFYVSVQRSVATTLGMAAALGECGPRASAMDVDPDTMGIEGPAASDPSVQTQAWSGALAATPDYPRASRFEASPAFTSRPGRTIDRVVIHITDANTTGSTVGHFTRADANSSAHYLVGQDGEIVQFVRELDIAWHAHGVNSRSIGIEHVCVNQRGATYGRTTLPALPPTDIQYAESAALVSYLCDKYSIPTDRTHIIGHSEADAHTTHTSCPNAAPWDWDHFMQMIQQRVSLPTGQSLGLPPRTARLFDAEIPLDPGVGGQSIGMNALQVGDIILSTTDATISRAIRAATSGQVSHVMLYVDQGGQVIEAVGEGVRMVPLGDAIASATVAVAFRVPGLTRDQRQQVADAAAAHIGQDYNHIGIARQALFQIDQRLCSALPNGLSDRCRAFAGRIDMGTASNDSFFCSELVLEAYRAAGQPLTSEQPNWASPDDIANLRFDFSKLRYIGHLKAAPSGGLFGHLLAYAKSTPARAMDSGAFSVTWDDVDLVPQHTGTTCVGAATAMVVGWRDRVSVDEDMLARLCAISLTDGQSPLAAARARFAKQVGLEVGPPQCFNVDGFRQLVEAHGPMVVTKLMAPGQTGFDSGHAVVVVGLYSDGTNAYVRVADPWDRVVGTPQAPGSYLDTHTTGSRYIMRFEEFMNDYEMRQARVEDNILQIMYAPDTGGRQPNRGSPPAGYAQSYAPRRMAPPPPTRTAARGLDVGPPPLGMRRTETTARDGVTFSLEQLDGMRAPRTQVMMNADIQSGMISVADWPRMPDEHGRTFGAVKIAWHYGGGTVGDVRVMPENAGLSDGWSLAVEGEVLDGPDSETVAGMTVELRHRFTHATQPEHRSAVRVILHGDGRHDRTNEWELDPLHVSA